MSGGDRNCYKCGKPGHFSRECESSRGPPGGGGFSRDTSGYSSTGSRGQGGGGRGYGGGGRGSGCYNCGRDGHISRDCPDRSIRGSRGGGGGNCYNCGEPGHFARECTKAGSRSDGGGSRDRYRD